MTTPGYRTLTLGGILFFISSDRKKCFQQKLNQQIFNAIIRLSTYSILILIVKSGYLIDKNDLDEKKSEFFTLTALILNTQNKLDEVFFLVRNLSVIYALQCVKNTFLYLR